MAKAFDLSAFAYAHRGLWLEAGPVENSLAAFRAAAEAGLGVEFDVRPAADGTPDRGIYKLNLAITEALIKRRDVGIAPADEAAYQTELNEFYSESHWFKNYGDTPWAEGPLCYKATTQYWAGLQCYSPRCAEPSVASFTCGGVTLSAKSF